MYKFTCSSGPLHQLVKQIINSGLPCLTMIMLSLICFSLIRLEFNQQHLNYYTELDAVCLHGTQVYGDSLERLMSALHLSPKTPKTLPTRQLSLTKEHDVLKENGLFDSIPVGITLDVYVSL